MHLAGPLIAGLAGVLAGLAGAEPTGQLVIDTVIVLIAVAATSWIAGSAPWWATFAAAFAGAMIAADTALFAVGAVVSVAALARGFVDRTEVWSSTVLAGLALNVLIRSEAQVFFGFSALVGIAMGGLLIVTGVVAAGDRVRRVAMWSAVGVAGFVVLAVVGAGIAGLQARGDLDRGSQLTRDAVRAVNDGDYARASALFAESASALDRAGDQLDGAIAKPARLVPGVAQNLEAGVQLSRAAMDVTDRASRALAEIDPSELRMIDGAIDLDAIRAAEGPIVDVQDALASLRSTVDEVRSPWLLDAARTELDEFVEQYDENEARVGIAVDAVRLAPAMLGGDGTRRYLVLFTTPAEARGLGGFVGNYVEVVLDDGRLSVGAFSRRSDLEASVAESGASCAACPAEFLDRYGAFGFTSGPDGGVAERAWSNITMAPHFPHVAETAALLYPQSGGGEVDGVVVLDPYVVEALMQYTGPVELSDFDTVVQPDQAADFILREQYTIVDTATNIERIDALAQLGQAVIDALLEGALPGPADLARDLGPLVDERRLLMWTSNAEEQRVLDGAGLLGSLPALDEAGGAGFSVSLNNAAGNKIDVFLERRVDTVVVDTDGARRLVVDVVLANGAPAGEVNRYVTGNVVGLPDGYSRTLVTFYGPGPLDAATLDASAIELETGREVGWTTARHFIELGPGESVAYRLEYPLGPAASGEGPAIVTWEQPLTER